MPEEVSQTCPRREWWSLGSFDTLHVLNPADYRFKTFDGLVLSICNILGLCLLLIDSTLMLLVKIISGQNVVHETSTLYKSILWSDDIDARFFLFTSALFTCLTFRFFSVIRIRIEQRFKEKNVVLHGYVAELRIPVDTRSPIPVISVQSVGDLQYRWQS